MKDETYVFIKDSMDKKAIGRSAFNKRTHAGGSGMKKWAAEYMSNKELSKMNGELKTYRLNDPMTWAEFKAMPDDIKKMYIQGIRERFSPPDNALAKMLGVHPTTVMDTLTKLGLHHGEKNKFRKWDKAGFEAWASGKKVEELEVTEEAVTEVTETFVPECPELTKEDIERLFSTKKKVVPTTGAMTFRGKTEDILETIASVLGGAELMLAINWDVMDGDEE
jgi:hypothetical protein